MNIGILSKRTTMFAGMIKEFYENKGFNVKIYTLQNLAINETLLNMDFYILKSKWLFFLYAGYYLVANNKKVIPNPQYSFLQKNRVHSHYLVKKAGLNNPDFYLGTLETLKNQLTPNNFPLIAKPIMGSGSKGVKLINSLKDLKPSKDKILYLENFIEGIHYNVYFIDNHICTVIKPPLANEHVEMKKITTPNDVEHYIEKWKRYLGDNALFGHLDIVRNNETNQLYVVDVGSFPEFAQWQINEISPVETICSLILNKATNSK